MERRWEPAAHDLSLHQRPHQQVTRRSSASDGLDATRVRTHRRVIVRRLLERGLSPRTLVALLPAWWMLINHVAAETTAVPTRREAGGTED